jgi:hypothetical protein
LYFINLNELANGDLKVFLEKEYNNFKVVNNAIAQIYLAILSFHSIGYVHNDSHWGNFLYHKINPGGYIKYIVNGKEIYLENLGYLWVIWDYSLAAKLIRIDVQYALTDYNRVLRAFMNEDLGWLPTNYPLTKNTEKLVTSIRNIFLMLVWKNERTTNSFDAVIMDKLIKETDLYIMKADLQPHSKIVNSNAYIINI